MSTPVIYRNEGWESLLHKSINLEDLPIILFDVYYTRKKVFVGILSKMEYREQREFPTERVQQTFINVILSDCNSGEEILKPRIFDIRERQVDELPTRLKGVSGRYQTSLSFPTFGHKIAPFNAYNSFDDFKPELEEAVRRYSRFKTIPKGFSEPCRKMFKI